MIVEACEKIVRDPDNVMIYVGGFGAFYIADQILEGWMGKTDKIKSGSKAELIINLFRAMVAGMKKPKGGL